MKDKNIANLLVRLGELSALISSSDISRDFKEVKELYSIYMAIKPLVEPYAEKFEYVGFVMEKVESAYQEAQRRNRSIKTIEKAAERAQERASLELDSGLGDIDF